MHQAAISTSIVDQVARHTLEWKIHWLFRLALFCEFVGHGAFGVPLPTVSAALGGFEMLLGLCCLVAQGTPFFLFVLVWKLGTELLYVPAQAYGAWWEIIERGSSYAAPLLWIEFSQVVQCLQRNGSAVRSVAS